ncbi:hypothetical protein POTOM_020319 [Populus tomentosa]|uniref:Uncharacterized protein n=1 Tax=Populus tomentosa TaxID=118781 RepID=A0A8X8A224_POPTO|nr:hypothetical protein POTOM_020319 [Populus tomentosa]
MNKRKTSCDHSKLLVATLFRLETEIQEAMLRPERSVPTKSTGEEFQRNLLEAEEMRSRTKKLEETTRNAVEEGGSSCSNFSALIE